MIMKKNFEYMTGFAKMLTMTTKELIGKKYLE